MQEERTDKHAGAPLSRLAVHSHNAALVCGQVRSRLSAEVYQERKRRRLSQQKHALQQVCQVYHQQAPAWRVQVNKQRALKILQT